jgi:hypothetical protein
LTQLDRNQNGAASLQHKLVSSQIGLRANLVASQFETGFDSRCRENQKIKRGFRRRNPPRSPEKEEKK